MAKIYLDRLKKKYKFKPGTVTGINYRTLMQDIILNQTESIARATARLSKSNFDKQNKKITSSEKRLVLPNVEESLPKRSVFLRKAAQDGNIITDTLRDSLTGKLRKVLQDFKTAKTEEPAFIRRRGKLAGTINPKVIDIFQKEIIDTYKSYTKRDPSIGVPPNVKQIAVTEIRSTVNEMKQQYNKRLYEENKDKIKMFKRWRQNRALSKNPRVGHSKVNGMKISMDELFRVPLYEERKGKIIFKGVTWMLYPHDPSAPLEQVIGCNCDIEYFAQTL